MGTNWFEEYVFKYERLIILLFLVIPARPENLTVVNKTLDSVLLYWNVPFPLQNFPPGLEHKIMYENQWDPHKTWSVRLLIDLFITLILRIIFYIVIIIVWFL